MTKKISDDGILKENHLADAEAPVRAIALKSLPKPERLRVMENLVESAMVMGLMEDYQIKEWLGIKSVDIKSITAAREKVMRRWIAETSDVVEYAKTQRATQINKAWEEVRNCEEMFEYAKTIDSQVKVKQLQLQWMTYISKLSFVDKMVEANQPDMQIVVQGGLNIEEKDNAS